MDEKIEVGRGNIWAEIIADSISEHGDRLTTFRLHYPRFIHSEVMTHRMFSRNASSSRAIPVNAMLDYIANQPAMPIHWGANQPGMQAKEEIDALVMDDLGIAYIKDEAWKQAATDACITAKKFADAGYHKQIVNRLTEPFQFMNVIVSATDFDNFFWLRLHADAQPEICELAKVMYEVYLDSEPEILYDGEWHTPFVTHHREGHELFYLDGDTPISDSAARKISASCCAQVSYRRADTSLEKAFKIYERLVESEPVHASPFEHVATPFTSKEYGFRNNIRHDINDYCEDAFADQIMYDANFRGWHQFRRSIPNETFRGKFHKNPEYFT